MEQNYFVNEIFENIWNDRYRKNNETVDENFQRVAKYISQSQKDEEDFLYLMRKGLFFPAGRTMSNAGIGVNLTLNNCFTAPPIQDSLAEIFDAVKLGATTHQKGGGIGYDFSYLRPAGTPTSNDAIASGPVSFMDVFNAQTATILQGNRRGANMGILNIYHPDIEEFITAKSYEAGKLVHFNLSVMVDDAFIDAVRKDEKIFLHFPVYDKDGYIENNPKKWTSKKEVSARELWNLITKKAYDNGEPGIFFYDNLNKDNNIWYEETITTTNPCSEYLAGIVRSNPQNYGGACNLGSLFLVNFVHAPFTKEATVNWQLLEQTIFTAVRMLDEVIDANTFPNKVYENYQTDFRTIGLGVTGLADMLVMLGLDYRTKDGRDFVELLMDFISSRAFLGSSLLAREKGTFPKWNANLFLNGGYMKKMRGRKSWAETFESIEKYGLRNAKIMSIAPTGTLSLTFGNNCSSGIEPIFSLEYERKVKFGGQAEEDTKIVKVRDFAYALWKNCGSPKQYEDLFATALEMTVEQHLLMLGKIAYFVDMSVSKTINIPTDYSFEDTQQVYLKAHDLGIKGTTIFRPNELRPGILITEKKEEEHSKARELQRGEILTVSEEVIGKKRKLTTGCGSLHVMAYFDVTTGELREVYLSKGSEGGCASFMNGLSRMISVSARAGVAIGDIVDQLNSCTTCPSYAVRKATKHDTSKGNCCPGAVANALKEMWQEMREENLIDFVNEKPIQEQKKEPYNISSTSCPECGEPVEHIGGCVTCPSCGWSKCG